MAIPTVNVENLTVIRDRSLVLDKLTLHVEPGRITGLIGPSGSGKTTLMRVLVGTQKIFSGNARIMDQPAGSKQLRGSIGYVTQAPALYDDITVYQNLQYFARLMNVHRQRIATVLKQVDLDPQRNQVAGTLSGGQKARVSLAIALLSNAPLLILDEPTVGLDPLLRQNLWKLFADLAKQGKTLLISSHVMDEAELCDNIVLLREGKVLSSGPKRQLLANTDTGSVQAAFLKLIGGRDAR